MSATSIGNLGAKACCIRHGLFQDIEYLRETKFAPEEIQKYLDVDPRCMELYRRSALISATPIKVEVRNIAVQLYPLARLLYNTLLTHTCTDLAGQSSCNSNMPPWYTFVILLPSAGMSDGRDNLSRQQHVFHSFGVEDQQNPADWYKSLTRLGTNQNPSENFTLSSLLYGAWFPRDAGVDIAFKTYYWPYVPSSLPESQHGKTVDFHIIDPKQHTSPLQLRYPGYPDAVVYSPLSAMFDQFLKERLGGNAPYYPGLFSYIKTICLYMGVATTSPWILYGLPIPTFHKTGPRSGLYILTDHAGICENAMQAISFYLAGVLWPLDHLWHDLDERQQIANLRKYEQMLDLLASPLGNITDALATMQRDTQELRAVLYEPARAIFESHTRLNELFKEGQQIRISPDICIIAAHEPRIRYIKPGSFLDDKVGDDNLSAEAGIICAITAVCRIFGFENSLDRAHNLEELRGAARFALLRASDKAFERLRIDILWIWSRARCRASFTTVEDFAGVAGEDAPVFLERLKKIVFSPFKVNVETWDCCALELALKPFLGSTPIDFQNFDGMAGSEHEMHLGSRSPATYGAILDFLMDLCVSRSSRRLIACEVRRVDSGESYVIRLTFDETFQISEDRLKELRSLVEPIVGGLRDWRVVGTNLGNFFGPFIDLANKLLGLVKENNEVPIGYWRAKTCNEGEVISVKAHNDRCFIVLLKDEGAKGICELQWL